MEDTSKHSCADQIIKATEKQGAEVFWVLQHSVDGKVSKKDQAFCWLGKIHRSSSTAGAILLRDLVILQSQLVRKYNLGRHGGGEWNCKLRGGGTQTNPRWGRRAFFSAVVLFLIDLTKHYCMINIDTCIYIVSDMKSHIAHSYRKPRL